jgi:hypothetical protein
MHIRGPFFTSSGTTALFHDKKQAVLLYFYLQIIFHDSYTLIHMKKAPGDSLLHERLGPTKYSAQGFLGSDPRQIDEIIADDGRTCQDWGTAPAQIADALDAVFARAEAKFGAVVAISASISAVHADAKGFIPSPFPGEGTFQKGETIITNSATKEIFRVTRLSIHLIRNHGFFQGLGSKYRIEPERIALTLGLVSKDNIS